MTPIICILFKMTPNAFILESQFQIIINSSQHRCPTKVPHRGAPPRSDTWSKSSVAQNQKIHQSRTHPGPGSFWQDLSADLSAHLSAHLSADLSGDLGGRPRWRTFRPTSVADLGGRPRWYQCTECSIFPQIALFSNYTMLVICHIVEVRCTCIHCFNCNEFGLHGNKQALYVFALRLI